MTDPDIASRLIDSVLHYDKISKWHAQLFMIMPDHVHALLAFPADSGMAATIGGWKRFHHSQNGIQWQDNFFDHRIRNQDEFDEKAAYIRRNTVVKGLCGAEDDWTWVIDRQAIDAACK